MGVPMVADPDQALGLAVARMIREGLHRARQSTAVRRAVVWAMRHRPSGSTNIQRVQGPRRTYA